MSKESGVIDADEGVKSPCDGCGDMVFNLYKIERGYRRQSDGVFKVADSIGYFCFKCYAYGKYGR